MLLYNLTILNGVSDFEKVDGEDGMLGRYASQIGISTNILRKSI